MSRAPATPDPARRPDPDDVGAYSSMLASKPLRIATFALVLLVFLPIVGGRVMRWIEGHPLGLTDGTLALLAAAIGGWGRGLLRATSAGPARNADALAAVDAAPSPVDDLEAQALAAGSPDDPIDDPIDSTTDEGPDHGHDPGPDPGPDDTDDDGPDDPNDHRTDDESDDPYGDAPHAR